MNSVALLILLHGTRLSGAQWAGYAERLADVAEVVAPDLPGHGRRADAPFTLAGAVRVVQDLVDGAGERPVFVAGHSLGGFVAMSHAEQQPAHAEQLQGLAHGRRRGNATGEVTAAHEATAPGSRSRSSSPWSGMDSQSGRLFSS